MSMYSCGITDQDLSPEPTTSSANPDPSQANLLFHQNYELCEIIGKEPFSTVHKAIHKVTRQIYAVKMIDLRRYTQCPGLSLDALKREVQICRTLKHPYIVELFETFHSDAFFYLVYEHFLTLREKDHSWLVTGKNSLDGVDFCYEIVKRAASGFVYSESVASHYLKQIIQALQYLHVKGIAHRDLRPRCCVLANKENSAPVKLCNFGVVLQLPDPHAQVRDACVGSPPFMAPEVVGRETYGTSIDMWSLGVLMYVLLSGSLPFNGTKEEIYNSILCGQYTMRPKIWLNISNYARDLVMKLLTVDPSRRINAQQALQHPWILERETYASKKHLLETVEEMKRYNLRRRIKTRILEAVNSSAFTNKTTDVELIDPTLFQDRQTPNSVAVDQILYSIDQLFCLSGGREEDNSSFHEVCLYDKKLHALLDIYDRISTHAPFAKNTTPQETVRWCFDLIELIRCIPQKSALAVEFQTVLKSSLLQSILQAYDVISKEIYANSTSNNDQLSSSAAAGYNFVSNRPVSSSYGVFAGSSVGGDQEKFTSQPSTSGLVNGGNLGSTSYIVGGGGGAAMEETDELADDDISTLSHITRVRLVQFQKNTDEPMGITLKMNEEGKCIVARIMHGGMIHRQATLHVGDEIREINGVNVSNQSVDSLQRMLRDVRGSVTFKIVPSYRSAPPACEIFVRAQFDYDPSQDDLIPCPQAGVPFRTGDILQIISKDDHNWWQARHISSFPAMGSAHSTGHQTPGASVAGLIPSPELQEWRTACLAMERTKDNFHCMWFGRKKKPFGTKALSKQSALFGQLDLVTYEEVVRLPSFRRKTLVLLGAHGVGRRHIKNTLIQRHPDRFAYPIPHTTRPPRKDEIECKHYHFVSHEQMMTDIQKNEYLEYGTHEEHMYGTKLETIRQIHKQGKVAILDVEPQALKVLRTVEYAPFVVFIAAPNLQGLQDPDGSLERLLKESELLRQAYGHYFDFIIINNDIDETIKQLELTVEKLHTCAQWVSVSWVY